MIPVGKYSELEIVRGTDNGLYLKDPFGEEVLLPNKYCPAKFDFGDRMKVFVYLDHEARKVATTLTPKIQLNEFALLQVKMVTDVGAFMDWGMEKDLFVPFSEQAQRMNEGEWHVVQLLLDPRTSRLFATSQVENQLDEKPSGIDIGQEVDIIVYRETELGYPVIINNLFDGLVYKNEVFKPIKAGDKLTGYVKKIREDDKIDISIHPIGYTNFNDVNVDMVYQKLIDNKGSLDLGDKSDAGKIYATFGISKKAYKKAIGALYKKKKIIIKPDGITLITNK